MRLVFLLVLLLPGLLAAAVERNIEFSRPGGEPLHLDASVPDGPGPFAAVMIVHGGGFVRGSRTTYINPLLPLLSDAGLAWFSIDYRLAPKHRFEDSLDDIAAALSFVRANAKRFRIDPRRMALAGESAGGYLVAMFAARRGQDHPLRAVVDFYGPHDFVALTKWRQVKDPAYMTPPDLRPYFGMKADASDMMLVLAAISPMRYVRPNMPPFLLIHGTTDAQVDYRQSPLLCAALKKAGNACDLITLENGGHGMEGWEKNAAFGPVWKQPMVAWLQRHLTAGVGGASRTER